MINVICFFTIVCCLIYFGDTLLFLRLILVPNFQLFCAYKRVCPKSDVLDKCKLSKKSETELWSFIKSLDSISFLYISSTFWIVDTTKMLQNPKKSCLLSCVNVYCYAYPQYRTCKNFFFRILLYGRLGRRGSLFIFALCSTRWVP